MRPLVNQVLLATDFSHCSKAAFDYALKWAQGWNARLDVVHVLEFHPGLDRETAVAKMYFEEQRKHAAPKRKALIEKAESQLERVSFHEREGRPANQINQLAMDIGADVLVMGTHGWTGLNRVLLGSTAERVVSGAPCPVITVRGEEQTTQDCITTGTEGAGESEKRPDDVTLSKKLLVPLDFSDCSLDAFEYAVQVSKQFEAEIILLHVKDAPSYSLDFNLTHLEAENQKREEIESRIREVSRILQSEGLKTEFLLKSPPIPEAILETGKANQIDLVVMGTHGHRGLSRLFLGSVSSAILRHTPTPVLTVKSPKLQHGHSHRHHQPESVEKNTSAQGS